MAKSIPITEWDLFCVGIQIARAEGWSETAEEREERLIQHSEWLAENGYVLAQENAWDPEAQADLALHDFLHPDGYGR